MTRLINTTKEIKNILHETKRPLGFVPTMGALHAGHISLIKNSKSENKTSLVSIYVNPLQFGEGEDLEKYPRDSEKDLKVCQEYNVDYIFAPSEDEMRVTESEYITPPEESTFMLCGTARKNHFKGVATIVNKFFTLTNPDIAYFGEKDLQQLHIIRWLVNEFKIPVKISPCQIIRENSGLACSSRNNYLTKEQKNIAANIYKSLQLAKQNIRSGIFTLSETILESLIFLSQFKEIKIEYFEARDKNNLTKVNENQTRGFYFLIAVKIGNIRLIDNIEV